MAEAVQILIGAATMLLGALGLAYWANKAQNDRSAFVGLYLLFGIPGGLLLIAGMAVLVQGNIAFGGLLLLVALGLGLPLIHQVRELFAQVTPLDPDSAIDMAGLCMLLGLLGLFVANIFTPAAAQPPNAGLIPSVSIAQLVVQNAAFLAVSYIAAGYPYWRDLRHATARLGIVMPDARTVGFALLGTVGCFAVTAIAGVLAQQFDPNLTESLNEVVNQLTAEVQNPAGALLLGATAGIGEEALFRGALQPRYGLILTSLLFTSLHGPQYGFNVALLGLFGVSVILGLQRQYVNTTAAMITHALFNALQVLALYMLN